MEPIAVVGFSFKLPQDADSPEGFWRILMERRCTMTEWPKDRVNIDSYHNQDRTERSSVPARGANFIKEDPSLFDAPFFSITATEAASMDPQQRMLLETSYRAFENAGIPLEQLRGSNTGVYTGSMNDDYRLLTVRDIENTPKYAPTGIACSMLANRISWFFDLNGPSINLDSACSSSLMALHFACQGLRTGDTSMALVTGANLLLGVESMLSMTQMGFLSPDSRSFSFDERANGYARGEGIGVVVLKRLSDAIKDNDTIRAVIRSTGANQDGYTPGITVPSRDSQARLIRETYEKAGLDLGSTRYFEAHGTGTPVGDPLEAAAIGSVFQQYRSPEEPLYIGALKSNIGHLEGASGVAALIKAIMVLENGIIPPNTNFERPNPKIDADSLNIKFPLQSTPWPSSGLRRASVNSFGFGGSNAHAVLEDAHSYLKSKHLLANHSTSLDSSRNDSVWSEVDSPRRLSEDKQSSDGPISELLIWTAADEAAVLRTTDEYAQHLSDTLSRNPLPDGYCKDLSYTLSCRRSRFGWRSFAVIDSSGSLADLKPLVSKPNRASKNTRIAFVFTGQGAQYKDMGVQLLEYPTFRKTLIACDDVLFKMGCEWTIFKELTVDELNFNIVPATVVGHSSGEIGAAYAIGALSLTSAMKIAYHRGRLAGNLVNQEAGGSMLAIGLSEKKITPFLERLKVLGRRDLTVACINSPVNITIAGSNGSIRILKALLDSDTVFCRELKTGVAYHSPQMQEVADEYRDAIQDLEAGEPVETPVSMISSVTGDSVLEPESLRSPDYWVRNMVQSVKFSYAMERLVSRPDIGPKPQSNSPPIHDIIEIGPHAALQRPVIEILEHTKQAIRYTSALSRFKSGISQVLEMTGKLFCAGYDIHLDKVNCLNMSNGMKYKCLTDLPQYSFTRQKHWHESPLSRNLRLRHHFPRPLLGAPVQDWNPLEPKWRRYFDVQEFQWTVDHKVNGMILFPAAGMLVVALEAVQETANKHQAIKGFFLKEAIFSNPIPIPTKHQERAEVETYLRTITNALEAEATWSEVRICVRQEENWNLACRATIQVQYASPLSGIDDGSEETLRLERMKETFQHAARDSQRKVDQSHFYQHFARMGLQYGPMFRGLHDIKWDNVHSAVGKIRLPGEEAHPYLVHPATLDAMAQLAFCPITRGGADVIPTSLPTRVRNAWFSLDGLDDKNGNGLRVSTRSVFKGFKGTDSSLVMLNENGEVAVSIESLETTMIATKEEMESENLVQRRLCFNIDSKPDIDMLESDQLLSYIEPNFSGDAEQAAFYKDLDRALKWFIATTLAEVTSNDAWNSKPHMRRYIDWLRFQARRTDDQTSSEDAGGRIDMQNAEAREEFFSRIGATNDRGKLYVTIGRQLLSIIRDQADPLEILFQTDLAERFYEDLYSSMRSESTLWKYLDALGHKNPSLKILEVGAGTGSMTGSILAPLLLHGDKEQGTPRFSRYDYTDISVGFFEKAKEKFAHVYESGRMHFQSLDLENDPAEQGFELGSYDLVVAASVLHATKNVTRTLEHVRKLLKPAGRLVLLELVEPEILRSAFIFGLLPGWWLSTDSRHNYRQWSPGITEEQWSTVLTQTGFSGADAVVRDHKDEFSHEWSFIFSTAVPRTQQLPTEDIVLIVDSKSETQTQLAAQVQSKISSKGVSKCRVISIDRIPTADLALCSIVFLPESERPFLRDLTETDFQTLKDLLSTGKRLLWVTQADRGSDSWPDCNTVTGFARVFRSENPSRPFTTLSLEGSSTVEANTNALLKTLEATAQFCQDCEIEYIMKDGILEVNRIIEANSLDQIIRSKTTPKQRGQAFGEAGPLVMTVGSPGVLDSLRFVRDHEPDTPLAPEEVEVEVKAVGLNFKDVLVALGRVEGHVFGNECAGFVRRVGAGVQSLQPGDRVCAAKIGSMKSYVRGTENNVINIPDSLSFEEAASLPVVGTTAYYALIEMGRLAKYETILIHAGAGATGQMCIQLAQLIGAEVFTTVSSPEKKELLMTRYGIPEDHIFYSRNTSFAKGVMRKTNNCGVDMIVNSLSGDSLVASWEVIAPFGRFIEIGRGDIRANSKLPMVHFDKNVSFIAAALDYTFDHRPAHVKKMFLALSKMMEKGEVRHPYPLKPYSISQAEEAFRLLQSGRSIGKVVVTVNPADVVQQTYLVDTSPYQLRSDASYLIAGGLGGLGRSAARWMVSKGARHLILLSRSGPTSKAAIAFINKLRDSGVQVQAPRCDVSSEESLAKVVSDCSTTMPPIKGCLQCTMVLNDTLFEKMKCSDWNIAVRPKIQASWNLHKLLPSGMDFFILLSSLSGIVGTIGQSNYAAGNTYQDALAHHRLHLGEKAVSLDLGVMAGVGIIAENKDYAHTKETMGAMLQVQENEFHALLDHYCDPNVSYDPPQLTAQAAIGLPTPQLLRSKGLEPPPRVSGRLFSGMDQIDASTSTASPSTSSEPNPTDYTKDFIAAESSADAEAVVVLALVAKLSRSLSVPAEEIDTSKQLFQYGVDSLVGVELRNWFAKEFMANVAIFNLMGAPSIAAVGKLVVGASTAKKVGVELSTEDLHSYRDLYVQDEFQNILEYVRLHSATKVESIRSRFHSSSNQSTVPPSNLPNPAFRTNPGHGAKSLRLLLASCWQQSALSASSLCGCTLITYSQPFSSYLLTILNAPALEPLKGVKPNFVDLPNLRNDPLTISLLVLSTTVVWIRLYKLRQELIYAIAFHCYVFEIHLLPTGVHQWNLLVKDMLRGLRLFHYAEIMYTLSIVPLKAAIILQCLRVFVPDGIRDSTFWISHLLLWANAIFYITVIFVEAVSCSPRAAIWDVTIKGKCLNRLWLHYISADFNSFSDLLVSILPQRAIWNMTMPRKRQVGLSALFLFGVL
ncbi:hypothetical protein K469DRAFT_596142 [Zopfia rhizophila CBS 207.26]|uniref:Uncharacterized protein n=1 Tax=Zopfia rhizophila CBS 207.26 TaxID=1314779 RepID=A0A6A6DP68_9PEZI|nr:hypothetical protein K469DRAFT_596142 [Zopfia rhizophila CBS 207.26]